MLPRLSLRLRLSPASDPDEVLDNLRSVERVPAAILPHDSPARLALIALAAAGTDTYCYASGGELTGTWCAWLGDLARARSDRNGRVSLAAEWVTRWRDLLAAMGYAEAAAASEGATAERAPEGEARP